MQLDNSQLLTASSDKSLRLWDCKTGEELAVLEGHMDSVVSVAVAGDGLRGASASLDKTVRNACLAKATNRCAGTHAGGAHGSVVSVAVAGDGLRCASAPLDDTVRGACTKRSVTIWTPA